MARRQLWQAMPGCDDEALLALRLDNEARPSPTVITDLIQSSISGFLLHRMVKATSAESNHTSHTVTASGLTRQGCTAAQPRGDAISFHYVKIAEEFVE